MPTTSAVPSPFADLGPRLGDAPDDSLLGPVAATARGRRSLSTLWLRGHLDASTADATEDALRNVAGLGGPPTVALDLRRVSRLDPLAARLLLDVHVWLSNRGGGLRLHSASPCVRASLACSGLHSLVRPGEGAVGGFDRDPG